MFQPPRWHPSRADKSSPIIRLPFIRVGPGNCDTELASQSVCRVQLTTKYYRLIKRQSFGWKLGLAMFRLDYLSCFLTVLATILVGRKSWTGLVVSIVNSLIVCVIGFRTSQFGFIPANLICICVYALSIRPWAKKTHAHRSSNHHESGGHLQKKPKSSLQGQEERTIAAPVKIA